ncbi:hypothetical protein K8352_14010 [Flavobacteriaceae bacterium F89]|uniref:SRPBCC domain-containing protein n=1 Tax=Cerina litoralis TaxID=2874477 RepID=A0AAE3EVK2_9FLAO|nr:hypothetical protein [Cerina litoralis]MCG2461870.1 hypothetical protein [Cerina litoralis]
MKNKLIILVFLGVFANAQAQSSFVVVEKPLPFNHWATSFSTDIIGVNETFVSNYWEKFIEDHKGQALLRSMVEGDVEYECVHVQIPFLNNEKGTIYTQLSPNDSMTGVLLTIWIRMKDGTFYSAENDPKSADNVKSWLLLFNQKLTEADRD